MTSPQILKNSWTSIEAADAGWTYVSFAVHGLSAGESVKIAADDHERTTVAARGHDLYYLNVLAGPADKRTLQAFQDPCLKATQDAWSDSGIDPRLPFVPRYPT